MPLLSEQDLLDVASVYVRANTARYFFDQLRKTPAVARISHKLSFEEIAAEIGRRKHLDTDNPECALTLVALLAALTLKTGVELGSLLDGFPPQKLPWQNHFLSMVARSIPTVTGTVVIDQRDSMQSIRERPQVEMDGITTSSGSTQRNTVTIS